MLNGVSSESMLACFFLRGEGRGVRNGPQDSATACLGVHNMYTRGFFAILTRPGLKSVTVCSSLQPWSTVCAPQLVLLPLKGKTFSKSKKKCRDLFCTYSESLMPTGTHEDCLRVQFNKWIWSIIDFFFFRWGAITQWNHVILELAATTTHKKVTNSPLTLL